jgi:hypothetical protein
MIHKTEKAGPVVGTDLRNSDLAIYSEHSLSLKQLQVSRLARLYAVNAAMAETIAPLVFLVAQ